MGKDKPFISRLTVKPKGKLLESLRSREGEHRNTSLTQKDVEEAAGLPTGRLYRCENGYPVPYKHIILLARYYKVPARDLIESESFDDCLFTVNELINGFELGVKEVLDGRYDAQG